MFSAVAIIFLLLMVIITYIDKSLDFNYLTYLIPMLFFVIMLIIGICFAENHPCICKALIYVFISLLAILAIAVGTVQNREQTAGTFLAFLLVIPLLFVMRPLENVCFIIFFDVLFIVMSAAVKERALFQIDMINALVFGSISAIISSFMLIVTVENYVMKDTLTHLAITDRLTQLQNRTCYEQRLTMYPTLCRENLACVFIDVNGLHELNETKGHQSGDIMLKYIADALKEQFGDFDSYRIGGDEYVAFVSDTSATAVEEKLKAFKEKLKIKKYHVSVGYEIQSIDRIEIPSLIKAAEEKMYLAKQEFYAQNPTVRRRHMR